MSNLLPPIGSVPIQPTESELLTDISEQDQEVVAGGFGFFYSLTDHQTISTSAATYDTFTASNSDSGTMQTGTSSQEADYQSERTTTLTAGFFGSGVPSRYLPMLFASFLKLF